MIEFANREMIPELKTIWTTCFGDDDAYTTFLFQRLLRPEHILVDTDRSGKPAAMLCLEPFTLASARGNVEGAYIFGVATLPEAQGKGRSSALLEECHKRLRGDGFALSALVPAGESLFDFYGKRGYETEFEIVKAEFGAGDIAPAKHSCVLTPASLGGLADLRDRIYLTRSRLVRWYRDYLAYIGDECKMLGGEVLRVGCMGEAGYAVCYRAGDAVFIKELALRDDLIGDAMSAIHARFQAARYVVYLPADTQIPSATNKVLPFAMVRWYDKEKQERLRSAPGAAAWIAHVLD